jgi:hypothetical protein
MYRKLALGVLIVCTGAFGLNHMPSAHADTLTGCSVGVPCSDAFFQNGVPVIVSIDLPQGTDLNILFSTSNFLDVGVPVDPNVMYIFTEEGTGTSGTAPVSDLVEPFGIPTALQYISDPFELDVSDAISLFAPPNGVVVVLEETGTSQPLTAFNPNLTVQFGSDVSAVPLPAALPLFVSGLIGLGLLDWRRKKKAAA